MRLRWFSVFLVVTSYPMLCSISLVCIDDGKVLRSFTANPEFFNIRKWRELFRLLSDYRKNDVFCKLVITPNPDIPF